MSETQEFNSEIVNDLQQTHRAIRFALVSLLLAFSYFNVRANLAIPKFAQIFADMIEGRPLPIVSNLVIRWKLFLLVVSCLLPALSLVTLFLRSISRSFYILGVLALLTGFQFVIVWTALTEPLIMMVSNLSGAELN